MNDTPELPRIPTLLEQLQDAFTARVDEIQSVDDLEQAFEDRRTLRLVGFLYDIRLAAVADAMGPRGRDVASSGSRWSPQTITRLARLLELQEQLLTPDLPLGVYWYVLVTKADDLTPKEQAETLTWAINNSASVADVKQHLGDDAERTGGSVVHCEVIEQDGRRVVAEGDEVQAIQIKGHPISIRVLKRLP